MKTKTLIIYALTIIVLVAGGVIVYATKHDPIQELVKQIEINESELQQLEMKQAELNQANDQAKEKLLNEYGLEIKAKEETIRGESRGEISEEELIAYKQYSSGKITKEERYAGKIIEDELGVHQEMPAVGGDDSHQRFKELATSYGLDASQIRTVENHYGIKEGVILCITIAETSGGNRGAGGKNIGSVGSNDRGDRPTYALMESGLEDIGKTLNNKYLGSKQTLGCLSNAGSCKESNDNGKRYATSESSWEKNMVACLSTIYGSVDASTFTIRR